MSDLSIIATDIRIAYLSPCSLRGMLVGWYVRMLVSMPLTLRPFHLILNPVDKTSEFLNHTRHRTHSVTNSLIFSVMFTILAVVSPQDLELAALVLLD